MWSPAADIQRVSGRSYAASSGVETVFFGASIADAEAAGFRQIPLSAERVVELGGDTLRVVPGLLAEACRTLFAAWRDGKAYRPY
jgi:hypothetical protein